MDLVQARRQARRLPNLVSDGDFFAFTGGLNLVDTPLQVRPGQLLGCKNYECAMRGGYERLQGIERYDGHPRPSEAIYWVLDFDQGNSSFYPGISTLVQGLSSGASGLVIAELDSTIPTGRLALRGVQGVFTNLEPLYADGIAFGRALGGAVVNDATTDEQDSAYKAIVREAARSLIGKPPGEGPILGVVTYRGVGFAVRNNTGSTAACMYKATSTGWSEIQLGVALNFDAGTVEPRLGTLLTGGTSAATAIVRRILKRSGDWSTHDAAGVFVLTEVTGTFADNETLTGLTGAAVANGSQAEQSFPPGGAYEFRVHNFYGDPGRKRLYGVNGTGPAFEYSDDPEFCCFLDSGMASDAPAHLAIHKNQLWLAFEGGSVQKSGTGEPADWTAVSGAFELAVGDEVTGFLEEVGGTLIAFSRNQTKYVTGNEADGYAMDNFSFETGAYAGSIQRLGQGVYIDDRGFTALGATQSFGNFAANSVSALIDPLVHEVKNSIRCSVASKKKNRLRYFFNDGRFITIGFIGKKIAGFTTCDYGIVMACAHSGEDAAGDEQLLMGGDDGMVYQADVGTSIDGEVIQAFLRPVFHHSGSPSRIKRYRMAHVDVSLAGPTSLKATVDYSFANPESSYEPVKDVTLKGGGGFWDVSKWNEFRWSAGAVGQATFKLEGSGFNIGLLFSSESAIELPHTLNGVTFFISMRRLNRST